MVLAVSLDLVMKPACWTCLPPLEVMATTQTRSRRVRSHDAMGSDRLLVVCCALTCCFLFLLCSLHGDFQSIYSATTLPYSEKFPPIKYRVYKQLQWPWPFKLRYSLRYKRSLLKSFLKIRMLESTIFISTVQNHEGQKKQFAPSVWGSVTGNCFIFS